MPRNAKSFRRTKAKFKPQPRVLVICEDSKSSKNYLEDASIHYRSHALVEFSHCGRTDPLGIVEAALKRASDFDAVFCVIDRDTHQNFDEAIALAHASGKLSVLTSYPCFEFWLLLHFVYSRAPFMAAGANSAADRVVTELRKHPGMDAYAKGDKTSYFSRLLPQLEEAEKRALRALADAELVGEKNPSTSLHVIVEKLRRLAEPQDIEQ